MHDSSISVPRLWFSRPNSRVVGSSDYQSRDCDCPCACPAPVAASGSASFDLLLERVKAGVIQDVFTNQDTFVSCVGDHTLALSARGQGVVVMDAEASQLLDLSAPCALNKIRAKCLEWPDGVFERTVAFLIAQDLLSSPQVQNAGVTQSQPSALAAWLHLTNQCNLLCEYCYILRDDQRMSRAVAQHAIDAVFSSALVYGYSCVKLKYSGGEPTLNFDALCAAQRCAEMLCTQTGIELEAVLLTNGVHITDAQIDALLAHDLRVVVSLDGMGQYQDAQRPSVHEDRSSFDSVDRTLCRLLDRGISPHISITITKQSLGGLPELVEYLLGQELQFSLNFYREPDCSPRQDKLVFTPDEVTGGIQQMLRVIERRLPRYSLLSNLADRADLQTPHLRACGVGQDYMVIACDGSVLKCQMDMEHPVTTVYTDNPLAIVRADTDGVQNLPVDLKECRECVWRYRCAGGCPRLTFKLAGRYDAKSPLCQAYQAVLPEVARLEALRLLEYEEPWDFRAPLN